MDTKILMTCIAVVLPAAAACGGSGSTVDPSPSIQSNAVTSTASTSHLGSTVIPHLPASPTSASTVPANGDINPYGVAFVPPAFPGGGILRGGDVIISNFNNSDNLQGTGTTIVRVNANAAPSLFFADATAPGLSTALGVLQRGFVLVGNLPSTDGSGVCTEGPGGQEENVGQGALLVIDRRGKLVRTLTSASLLDGPWDLTVEDEGSRALVFVSNALSGTVTRLDLEVGGDDDADDVRVVGETQIASGYAHRCDPAAFVVGPTGLALDQTRDVLYVASTGDNAVFAIRNASSTPRDGGRGQLAAQDSKHFHGPLGLARAPNGDLISAQGDAVNPDSNQPSEIVEVGPDGRFVAQFSIDPAPGSAFGLAIDASSGRIRFAAVDDGLNVLDLWDE